LIDAWGELLAESDAASLDTVFCSFAPEAAGRLLRLHDRPYNAARPMNSASHPRTAPTSGASLSTLRRALLRWYDKHRRNLPWRRTRDPYRIGLSEIMLQQTRVAAVREHYRLFLERFPNLEALAKAPESSVLAAWSGLGYYRRARMLHQCAQKIVSEHRGRFPQSSEVLRSLPGIGRYTAAAIASIAFAEPVAVVDGNVERVLGRIVGRNLTLTETWQRAELFLSKSRPGDFNQAMMELGATVCAPRQPNCAMCPIRKWCSTQGEVPRTAAPQRQMKKEIWCALEQRDGHIRLVQRSAKASLMACMWELPQWPKAPHRDPDALRWRTFRHSITVTDYTVRVIRGAPPAAEGNWIPIAELPQVPITGLTRKILKAAGII
jgi:A/G-specific adenine glycosylase